MKIKLQNSNKHFKEKIKNPKFKEAYELERVKVALAQKIAEIREELNIKQSMLAKKMHVSQQFISQIESGNNNLTIETLLKLAHSLNTNIQISFSKKTSRHPCLNIA